ncbi:dTDP-4-amino-4,6-dideoxygalactose transaminase [Solirubrobacter pauli]|uniref:dTDP-4-amino-4,6-dideoxygalactose transaminase n=1 Tax=Solirubrobacter pauli TaxID=166793 RepID=A0A660LC21_9ACTN|nr:DegT/DnrJ/EryC1/StrS family aminotransferase [Solirubrobacter pauli]RKQ91785.1 dTDP-4-amino-4,6-dideoxygalactose transaminase [Solirubrobacter pauli]
MSWQIPLTDVVVTEDDLAAARECLESGWLTMGPRTGAFEAAMVEWHDVPHAAAVSSGTAALHLACRALDLGPGDEVIVPAFTFLASAGCVRYCGATPVLADVVSPERPNLDPADVERRITPRTKAVIAVHFWGYPADIAGLRAVCEPRGIAIIEDAAQAIGARVDGDALAGTAGTLGCLSFFSKKQLSVGEGGMVLTRDAALDASVRSLRSHAMTSGTWDRHTGRQESYDVVGFGFNYRMDELRAAFGRARLGRLHAEIEHRRAAVRGYRERLADAPGVTLVWDEAAVEAGSHFAFAVLFADGEARAKARDVLAERGIQTTRYPVLHSLTEYASFAGYGTLPAAEAAADRHLALPLSALTTDAQLDAVGEAVRAAA